MSSQNETLTGSWELEATLFRFLFLSEERVRPEDTAGGGVGWGDATLSPPNFIVGVGIGGTRVLGGGFSGLLMSSPLLTEPE